MDKTKKCVFVVRMGWVVEQKTPRPSSCLDFTQMAEATRKGFEQGPVMILFEKLFWNHHGDLVSQ